MSVVVLIWAILAAFGAPSLGKLSGVTSSDMTAFLPSSAESTKVNDIAAKFSGADKTLLLNVVVETSRSSLSDSQLASINSNYMKMQAIHGIEPSATPMSVAKDNQAVLLSLAIRSDADMPAILTQVREIGGNLGFGLTYNLTGPALFSSDMQSAFEGIDGKLLIVAVAVVFVILLLVYRSPLLPVIVLLSSIVALTTVSFIVYLLAKAGHIEMNQQVQGILFILVIGAATDYSLLYIARYREELAHYPSVWTATLKAIRHSYQPIIAAGATVAAGLLCLLMSDLGSNKALGQVGGIGVGISVLVTLTFFPFVLSIFGRAVFWPKKLQLLHKSSTSKHAVSHPTWVKIAGLISLHPRRIWIITITLLLLATLGVFQLNASGVSQSELVIGKSEAKYGKVALERHFTSGTGSPVIVIAPDDSQLAVQQSLNEQPDVKSVVRWPKTVDKQVMYLATIDEFADSKPAREAVANIRDKLHAVDSNVLVGGMSALMLDTNNTTLHDVKLIMPSILIAITIILMILLRSIVAPLILLLSTILSFAATLGISAIVFNHLWHFPGSELVIILYAFVFLVALGIDYNIFLMTRVREEVTKVGPRKAVLKGLIVTGGVITSAGVVLAATFASLSVLPILFLVQIAFIVTFGVLLDTILVRSLLIPALSLEIGNKMWWPSKLAKAPNSKK